MQQKRQFNLFAVLCVCVSLTGCPGSPNQQTDYIISYDNDSIQVLLRPQNPPTTRAARDVLSLAHFL